MSESPESKLHSAAWAGDVMTVRRLIQQGEDVNWLDSSGESAIFGASSSGQTEVVAVLIEAGASVSLLGEQSYTTLHWAASHGNLKIIKLLVQAGADPQTADSHGRLPIDVAHNSGKGDHVSYLKTVGPQIASRRNQAGA